MNPGTRLQIDALAIDSSNPGVMYVASSYNFGSTTVHNSPAGVAMRTDSTLDWTTLDAELAAGTAVAELLPVSGETGAVYALTTQSRTPLALGLAPEMGGQIVDANAVPQTSWLAGAGNLITWVVAGLAALTLLIAVGLDLRSSIRKLGDAAADDALATQTVNTIR
jgi:hypothetical protein